MTRNKILIWVAFLVYFSTLLSAQTASDATFLKAKAFSGPNVNSAQMKSEPPLLSSLSSPTFQNTSFAASIASQAIASTTTPISPKIASISLSFSIKAASFTRSLSAQAASNPTVLYKSSKVVFKPAPKVLTLDDCLAIAINENRDNRQSRFQAIAAKAKMNQVWASQLPTANLSIIQAKSLDSGNSLSGIKEDSQDVTISETLQTFGRYRAQKNGAEANLRFAEAAREQSEIEVAFQVTRLFYDLILSQRLIKVASESVDQLNLHLEQTRKLYNAGDTSRFDLLRAGVQVSSAKPQLIKATHLYSTSMKDLLNYLGLDPRSNPTIDGWLPEELPPDLPLDEEKALNMAIENRPDLKGSIAAVEGAKYSMETIRKNLQPYLQISRSFGLDRGGHQPYGDYRKQETTQVGLVFPFLDSGLTKAQTQEAGAKYQQTMVQHEAALSTLFVELEKAISALEESFEVLASQEKNVEQAREALNIAEIGFKNGSKTSLDTLDAQLALTQARTLKYQALRDRAVAVAQFEKALGLTPGTFAKKKKEKDGK
ncbi:MAG: TolC family protein [Candidatus Riflebacteria bacterium]|nr:TolC family protein [Candidatus Riflebacteria bacterium]